MHIIYIGVGVTFVLVTMACLMMAAGTDKDCSDIGHCWHPTKYYDQNHVAVCCYCDLEFDPHEMLVPPGHGEFAPKTWYPTPPTVCPKRAQVVLDYAVEETGQNRYTAQ